MPKIQKCYLGQTRNLCLVNHPEVSTWEIWSCYNKNSDERNQHSHYMDTRQNERWNFKEIAKILEFVTKLSTRHTFWSWLIRSVNMKWMQLVFWMIHCGHDSAHRRTDGQTGKVKPMYPPSTSLGIGWGGGGGIIIKKQYEMDKTAVNSEHREVRWIRKAKHEHIL